MSRTRPLRRGHGRKLLPEFLSLGVDPPQVSVGHPLPEASRARSLRRGLLLEYFTIVWNTLEAVVGLVAGMAAGSIALVGFALDSVIEGLLRRHPGLEAQERDHRDSHRGGSRAQGHPHGRRRLLRTRSLCRWTGRNRSRVGVSSGSKCAGHHPGDGVSDRHAHPCVEKANHRPGARQQGDAGRLDPDDAVHLPLGLSSGGPGRQRLAGLVVGRSLAGLAIAAFAAKEGKELWTTKDLCCR